MRTRTERLSNQLHTGVWFQADLSDFPDCSKFCGSYRYLGSSWSYFSSGLFCDDNKVNALKLTETDQKIYIHAKYHFILRYDFLLVFGIILCANFRNQI